MTTEERLEELEKELTRAKRRSRVMLVAAVMTVAGMLLLGAGDAGVQRVVRAQKFELVDANGNVRAKLDLDTSGTGLWLYDQNGETRAMVNLAESGDPGLGLWDQNGRMRAALSLAESGEPKLHL